MTGWHTGLAEEESDEGVMVHRLKGLLMRIPFLFKDPDRRRYHPPFPDPEVTWRLHNLLNKIQPDILHAFGWINYSCAVASLGKRLTMIVSARDFGYICATRAMLYYGQQLCDGPQLTKCIGCATKTYGFPKAVGTVAGIRVGQQLFKRKVRAFHTSSTYVRDVISHFLPYKKGDKRHSPDRVPSFHVIPNISQDIESGVVQPEYLESLPDEPFILFVGALQPHKGIYELLSAYEKLTSPPPLVLIGTVWYDSPESYPEGVTVIKNAPHDVVMEAWSRSLFGVAPSICPEAFGNVIVEAMSKGKAVISSSIGGPLDIILHEETGLLVQPGHIEGLAAAMQRLIDNHDFCQRLGAAGAVRVAQEYAIPRVIPKYEALYLQFSAETSE